MVHQVGKSYVCEKCKGTFIEGWDDESAHLEALENFGRRGDEPGMARICDDCYNELMDAWTVARASSN